MNGILKSAVTWWKRLRKKKREPQDDRMKRGENKKEESKTLGLTLDPGYISTKKPIG
jgi:hypothetical protein